MKYLCTSCRIPTGAWFIQKYFHNWIYCQ